MGVTSWTVHVHSASIAALLLTLGAGAAGGQEESQQGPDRPFRYAEDRPPSSLHPAYERNMVEVRLSELMFEGLFTEDRLFLPAPALAKEWKTSPDGKQMTIDLEPHAMWHDGKPVLPEDVIFTIDALKDTKSGATDRGMVVHIQKAEKTGDKQVTLHFDPPTQEPESNLTFKIMPAHKFKEAVFKRVDTFRTSPMGTGPYKFVKWDDKSIEMERHKGYRKKPGLAKLDARIIPDKKVQLDGLQYGFLDGMITVPPRFRPVIDGLSDIDLLPYESLSWWYLGLNHKRGILSDRDVAEAITRALNREELRAAHLGDGETISGPFAPSSTYYNYDVEPYGYDLDAVDKIMKKAGYKKKKGVWTKGKKSLKLAFVVNKARESYKDVCLDIQTQLEKAGFGVELEWIDNASWVDQIERKGQFDITLGIWSFDESSDVFPLFHSRGAHNFIGYESPEMDKLLEQSRETNDPDVFAKIYSQVHKLAHEDLPYIFLWSVRGYSAISAKLAGVDVHPFRYFTWVTDWSWKGE